MGRNGPQNPIRCGSLKGVYKGSIIIGFDIRGLNTYEHYFGGPYYKYRIMGRIGPQNPIRCGSLKGGL